AREHRAPRGPLAPDRAAARPGAHDPAPALLRGHDAVADRRAARNQPDARVPPARPQLGPPAGVGRGGVGIRLLLIVNTSASAVTARARVVIRKALSADHEVEVAETSRRGH